MSHDLLVDARLYAFLTRCDEEVAEGVQAQGCPWCEPGVLHRASYPRKPRGGPEGLGPEYESRLSFCCSREGCRRRTTPPSLRFLGRKVYLAAVIVLVEVMRHGTTPARVRRLAALIGASERTLVRWRVWWREVFATSPWWKSVAGRLAPPPPALERLPLTLLERFAGDAFERLIALLRFISPITTTSAGSVLGR